jgi:hypothetical protein
MHEYWGQNYCSGPFLFSTIQAYCPMFSSPGVEDKPFSRFLVAPVCDDGTL